MQKKLVLTYGNLMAMGKGGGRFIDSLTELFNGWEGCRNTGKYEQTRKWKVDS